MSNPFARVAPGPNSFLPEEYIRERSESRANVLTLSLFAVTLACVLGAFVVTLRQARELERRKTQVNERVELAGVRIEQLKELESQQAQMMEKAEITSALIEKVPRWTVMGEIALRMPRDMRLDLLQIKSTRIDPPKPPTPTKSAKGAKPVAPASGGVKSLTTKVTNAVKGKEPPKEPERPKPQAPRFEYALTIEGAAIRNNDVADFVESLKNSPVLDKVDMPFVKAQREGDRELRKFQITATVRTSVNTKELAESLRRLVDARVAAMNQSVNPGEPTASAATPKE